MNITIEEMLMLLGDREVQIYRERKINESLRQENENLKKTMEEMRRTTQNEADSETIGIRDRINPGGRFDNRVVEFQQPSEPNNPELRDIPNTAQTAKGV